MCQHVAITNRFYKDIHQENINKEIKNDNEQIKLLENTIVELKANADEFSYDAEKKSSLQDIKATITKFFSFLV